MVNDSNTMITLHHKLTALKNKHQQLDQEIHHLRVYAQGEDIQIQRLKRKKLEVKEQITKLDGLLVPNIIA